MTDKKTTQQEINQILWKACDTFRGVVDPSEYKNYILVMLFIKYLSDVYKDTYEKYLEKYSGDKEQVKRMMERERFVLPDESGFDYLYEHRNDTNVGELINIALERIEEANKEKLENVFRNIDFNSEANLGKTKDRNARLKHLLEDFNDPRLDLRPSKTNGNDIIGDSYEYLISRFASDAGKKGGEFYTPSEVATLLAKLLDPQPGDRICDPTCGSGSLLIKVGNEVGNNNFSLYGQESNGSTWALCKMNMFLHGMDSAQIEWGDTIRNPLLKEGDTLMKFDIVVANPPFSLDKWGKEVAEDDRYNRFWRGVPPKSRGDYAFITHMVETLNERGKVGVVAPHGVLFRSGAEERIRKKFIGDNLLDAIIGLPIQLFYGTGIPAIILVFDKNKQNTDVLFIDASNDFEEGTNQNKLRRQDIEKIINTYKSRKTIDKYSYVTKVEEIHKNNFNLNIPRYVDTFEEPESIDVFETQKRINSIEQDISVSNRKLKALVDKLEIK